MSITGARSLILPNCTTSSI